MVAILAETPAFFLGRPTAEICRVVEFEPHKPCKQSCIEICPELWIVPGEDIVPVMVFRELGANQIGNLTWMPTKRQHRNGQPAYAGRLKKEVIWVLEDVSDAWWKMNKWGLISMSWQFALSRGSGAKELVKSR